MTLEEKIKELQETKEDLHLLLWLQELQVFREELENGKLFQTSKPEYKDDKFYCPYCGGLLCCGVKGLKKYKERFEDYCIGCGKPLDLE